jgi:hypothetical protein
VFSFFTGSAYKTTEMATLNFAPLPRIEIEPGNSESNRYSPAGSFCPSGQKSKKRLALDLTTVWAESVPESNSRMHASEAASHGLATELRTPVNFDKLPRRGRSGLSLQ